MRKAVGAVVVEGSYVCPDGNSSNGDGGAGAEYRTETSEGEEGEALLDTGRSYIHSLTHSRRADGRLGTDD